MTKKCSFLSLVLEVPLGSVFDALGVQFGPPNLSQMVSKMKPTSKHEHVEIVVMYYTFA